jgi:hypothetical protein
MSYNKEKYRKVEISMVESTLIAVIALLEDVGLQKKDTTLNSRWGEIFSAMPL